MTPVFFHIPKCAGTYVIRKQMALLHDFRKKININDTEPGKYIKVIKDGYIVALIIALDPQMICMNNPDFYPENKVHYKVNIDNITEDFIKNINILSIVIESRGFREYKSILEKMYIKNAYKWIILRNTFETCRSLYYYLNSSKSSHEPTHGALRFSNFEEYLKSEKLTDSWLIRNLTNLENSKSITEEDLLNSIKELEDFNVFDISEVEYAIKKVIKENHDIDIIDESINTIKVNSSDHNDIKLEDLDEETQKLFLERTKYDRKLYDYFSNREIIYRI